MVSRKYLDMIYWSFLIQITWVHSDVIFTCIFYKYILHVHFYVYNLCDFEKVFGYDLWIIPIQITDCTLMLFNDSPLISGTCMQVQYNHNRNIIFSLIMHSCLLSSFYIVYQIFFIGQSNPLNLQMVFIDGK